MIRTRVAGLLATALLAASLSAPAHADPTDIQAGETISGGCFLSTTSNDIATNGTNVGVIGDLSVTQAADGTPVPATIWCKVQVNGTDAPGSEHSYSGTGVQAGTDQISFSAEENDSITLCERDDINGNTGTYTCSPVTSTPLPPDEAFELADAALAALCAYIPGLLPPIYVDWDGDIWLFAPPPYGIRMLNCPPY